MKKIVTTFLALAMILCLLPLQAYAATYREGDFQYEVSDGKATITKYTGAGGAVTIPATLGGKTVISIGEKAFLGCSALTSVTIPDSITSVGTDAFKDCSGLVDVYITDIVAWCGIDFKNGTANPVYSADNLYLNDTLVTDLVIPDGVTKIGNRAFRSYARLTSITIPDSVTSIGSQAFRNCTGLTSITMGNGITAIGGDAFNKCTALTTVTIPDSVTEIGKYAFTNCTGLTSVVIGSGLTDLQEFTFQGCSALEEITLPAGMFNIADDAFDGVPLKTVHYGGTAEDWNGVELNNNTCFAAVQIQFTEPEPEPTEPAGSESGNTVGATANTPKGTQEKSDTVYIVTIIVLSVLLAGSWVFIIVLLKKKKAE